MNKVYAATCSYMLYTVNVAITNNTQQLYIVLTRNNIIIVPKFNSKCSDGDCTLTDHRSVFPVPAVVHSYSIVDAVRESRLITKAVDIIQVDGLGCVRTIKS